MESNSINMSSDVKPRARSSGRPSLREERAAATQRRILDAARLRFAEDGYGATTLRGIAAEAGVAVQTVYAVYRSKAGILRALRTALVHQPEAESLYAAALGAPDDSVKVGLFARSIRARWEAGADVVRVHAEAAASDASLREEVEQVLVRRRAGLGALAATLEGSLASELDVARASAILDALTMPEVYLELTGVAGWSADEYEAWLTDALRRELLRSA